MSSAPTLAEVEREWEADQDEYVDDWKRAITMRLKRQRRPSRLQKHEPGKHSQKTHGRKKGAPSGDYTAVITGEELTTHYKAGSGGAPSESYAEVDGKKIVWEKKPFEGGGVPDLSYWDGYPSDDFGVGSLGTGLPFLGGQAGATAKPGSMNKSPPSSEAVAVVRVTSKSTGKQTRYRIDSEGWALTAKGKRDPRFKKPVGPETPHGDAKPSVALISNKVYKDKTSGQFFMVGEIAGYGHVSVKVTGGNVGNTVEGLHTGEKGGILGSSDKGKEHYHFKDKLVTIKNPPTSVKYAQPGDPEYKGTPPPKTTTKPAASAPAKPKGGYDETSILQAPVGSFPAGTALGTGFSSGTAGTATTGGTSSGAVGKKVHNGKEYSVDAQGWALNKKGTRDPRFKKPIADAQPAPKKVATPKEGSNQKSPPSSGIAGKVTSKGKQYNIDDEGWALNSAGTKRDPRFKKPIGAGTEIGGGTGAPAPTGTKIAPPKYAEISSERWSKPNLVELSSLWTKPEIGAVGSYTDSGYSHMNGSLRDTKSWQYDAKNMSQGERTKIKNRITRLDSALSKTKLKEDVILYRGIKPDHAGKYLLGAFNGGKIDVDKGFMSASMSSGEARGWASGGVVLKINVRKGRNAISVLDGPKINYAEEREVILPRNTKLRYVKTSELQGTKVLEVEVID